MFMLVVLVYGLEFFIKDQQNRHDSNKILLQTKLNSYSQDCKPEYCLLSVPHSPSPPSPLISPNALPPPILSKKNQFNPRIFWLIIMSGPIWERRKCKASRVVVYFLGGGGGRVEKVGVRRQRGKGEGEERQRKGEAGRVLVIAQRTFNQFQKINFLFWSECTRFFSGLKGSGRRGSGGKGDRQTCCWHWFICRCRENLSVTLS